MAGSLNVAWLRDFFSPFMVLPRPGSDVRLAMRVICAATASRYSHCHQSWQRRLYLSAVAAQAASCAMDRTVATVF